VFHINHFYNHCLEHYVPNSPDKYGKYKTDSLEEISKCFHVEGGASLFEVLGYPSAPPSESAPSESVPPDPVPSAVVPSAPPGRILSAPEVELEALLQQAQTLFEEAQRLTDAVEEADKALATVNATKEEIKKAAVTAIAKKKEDALRTRENLITWETLDEAVVSSQAALAKVEAEALGTDWVAREARKCRVLAWNALVETGIKITNTAIMLRNMP